ncbi:CvpA family protein [Planktomarina sp.]|nr:CvpA family protein [Planktomarina sp.]MDA9100312.1 CvpA family protein [Planktomarina sp.]MDC1249553.1 CvpA family protein [Planktomarina sp.]
MDGFTIIDFGVIVIIAVSALLAFSRGIVREGMAIAGWIAAAILAFIFADTAQPLVRQIPYLGDILGDSCELLILASFAVIFAIALLIVSIFTPLLSSLVQKSILSGLDKNLGFIFGICRGLVLVIAAFFVYFTVMPNQKVISIETSKSATIFQYYADDFKNQNPETALDWVRTQYDHLINECSK